jgi:hypothetical protein
MGRYFIAEIAEQIVNDGTDFLKRATVFKSAPANLA